MSLPNVCWESSEPMWSLLTYTGTWRCSLNRTFAEFCPCSLRRDGLPLWLPMIPLHFPFILSGDLQTKSWGLAVVLCICVCSKVVLGETTQLVHISSWTQLSNHPRLTLFSGVNAWGCLLLVKSTSKHPVAGSTPELGNKCSFSACRLLRITRCGTWWQTHPQLHHSAETGPANRTELNFAAVSDPPHWQDRPHCTKDLN